MLVRLSLLTCAACAFVLVGCSATPSNQNAATSGNANTPATTAPATTAPAATAEKIGVPECDDFIAAYDACVSTKVPEQVRTQYKESIQQWRANWKKLAENPSTKGTLAAACKQSAE